MEKLVIKNTRGMEIPVSNVWAQDLALRKLADKVVAQKHLRDNEDIEAWALGLARSLAKFSD